MGIEKMRHIPCKSVYWANVNIDIENTNSGIHAWNINKHNHMRRQYHMICHTSLKQWWVLTYSLLRIIHYYVL